MRPATRHVGTVRAVLAIPHKPDVLARSGQRAHADKPFVRAEVLADLPHRVPRPRLRIARTLTEPAAADRRGNSNAEIDAKLVLSEHTVKTQVASSETRSTRPH